MTRPASTRAVGDHVLSEHPLAEAPPEWAALVGRAGIDMTSTPAWHGVMAGLNGAAESVVVARDPLDGSVRAVVPSFRYPSGPGNSLLHPGLLFGNGWTPAGPVADGWEPVTLVGSVTGYVTAPAGEAEPWLAAARLAAGANDPDAPGSAAVMYLPDSWVAAMRPWLADVPILLTSARVRLSIRQGTFEEHYATGSKRPREKMRNEHRRLSDGDRVITVERLTADNIPEFARLQALTQEHHGAFGDADFFVRLYERVRASPLADSAFALVCRHQGQAIGYTYCMVHGDALIVRSIGLDYERAGKYAEYFNLLVHEPVRYAIDHGLREIDLGVTGYEQKLTRGGEPVLMWSLLLRPPAGWTAEDTGRQNRVQATRLLRELGRAAGPDIMERLGVIARSGTPVLR